MNLHNAPIGSTIYIEKIHTVVGLHRRLLDIGLTPGAKVTCLYASPSGDPRAYLVRDAVIALRSEEANQIEISYEQNREGYPWD